MTKTKEELAKLAAAQRKWSRNNKEKVKAYDAKRFSPERARNNAEWARLHPERMREYKAKWERNNPEKVRANNATKRARRRGAPGTGITAKQRQRIIAESLGLCSYCNERRPLAIDHIDPIAGGGAHDISNAAAVCKPCNTSKLDRPLVVWLAIMASKRRRAFSPEIP